MFRDRWKTHVATPFQPHVVCVSESVKSDHLTLLGGKLSVSEGCRAYVSLNAPALPGWPAKQSPGVPDALMVAFTMEVRRNGQDMVVWGNSSVARPVRRTRKPPKAHTKTVS